MDAHWVAAMVVKTGANWAVCSADMSGVPLVVVKDASTVGCLVEQLAGEKDVKSAVSSVDSKVAMWAALTDASMAEHSAEYWAVESVAG